MADGGAGLTLSHGIAAAIGLGISAVGRLLWGASEKRLQGQIDALREINTELRAQRAVDAATIARLENSIMKLGREKDERGDQIRRLQVWGAGVVRRVEEDPRVDDALLQEPPTGVYDVAEMLGRKSTPPKGTQGPLLPDGRRYRGPGEGT